MHEATQSLGKFVLSLVLSSMRIVKIQSQVIVGILLASVDNREPPIRLHGHFEVRERHNAGPGASG
ncbi:MAG TPA: hypothetical protein VFO40_04350 [Chthoniobacterales bacterium]|nr:hypothetical protein [Chthoniobacterales bacterium]